MVKHYRKKRSYRKRKGGMKKAIKAVLNSQAEKKFFSTPINNAVPDTGFTPIKLTPIPQGLQDTSRVGDSIRVHHLNISYSIACGDTTNIVRVIIVRWKPDDSFVGPSVQDILQFNSGVSAPHSPYNMDNYRSGVFKILHDKVHGVALGGPNATVCRKVKRVNMTTDYIASSTSGFNQIYIFAVSDSLAVTHPQFTTVTRVVYTDY